MIDDISGDLGGADRLSEGQRQLIRRASMQSAESERQEALAVRGDAEFDIAAYGMATALLCRVFTLLGVKRIPRDVDAGPLREHFSRRP